MASPFVASFHQSTSGSWNAQLSCCNCGRWIETGGIKSVGSTPSPSDTATAVVNRSTSEDRAFGMPSEVQKRELASMAWHNYCTSCRGIVCSICVSVALDAMACPQCLSLHPVASGNASSLSLPTNLSSSRSSQAASSTLSAPSLSLSAVFSNRCKKCSSCPSCNSPALGLRSLLAKEAPESLRKLCFSSPVPAAASTIPSSTSIPQSISFYHCSFCRWSSIDLPASTSSALSTSSSSAAPLTSHLLFSDSTAKLISRSLQIERERSDKWQFQALVEQRRQHLAIPAPETSDFLSSTTFSSSSKPKSWSHDASSTSTPSKKRSKTYSRSTSVDRKSGSTVVVPPSPSTSHALAQQSPLLHMISTKRQALDERINHPIRSKYDSRPAADTPKTNPQSFPVSFSPGEIEGLEHERQGLDAAWKTIQENPLHYFRPASRDPIAPLHSRLSATSSTLHHLHNTHSPIASHPLKEGATTDLSSPISTTPSIPSTPHPERIPLFPICTKKCMKCERMLIKPTVEGSSLSPSVSSASPADAFAALPDFGRRHTALSYAPLVEVKAANAFEDYKPSLILDDWNMLSITISNPPMQPAIHLTLSSDFEATPLEEEGSGKEKNQDFEGKGHLDEESSSVTEDEAKYDEESTKKDEKDEKDEKQKKKSNSPGAAAAVNADVVPQICQVDCNGCETWILEDEPISLEDDPVEEEEGQTGDSKPDLSWLSHPGVPSHLSLLESDTDNPAISGRKSRQVTLVVLVMPDGKKLKESRQEFFNNAKQQRQQQHQGSSTSTGGAETDTLDETVEYPPITCQMQLKISWPSPTPEDPAKRNELTSLLRINLSNVFDKPDLS